MKKFISFILVLLVACIFTGCMANEGSTESETSNTSGKTLTWLISNEDIPNENYFNQVLKEKGFGFRVQFVKTGSGYNTASENKQGFVDAMKNQIPADIIITSGDLLNEYGYMYDLLVQEGVLLPLDDYISKENDNFLNSLYNPRYIEGYRIDGSLYGLPEEYTPCQSYFMIDKMYVDKYGIEYNMLDGKPLKEQLNQITKIFEIVCEPEQDSIRGIIGMALEDFTYGYTNVCSIPFIAVDETNDKLEAVNLFEEEQLLSTNEILKEWIQKGYMEKAAGSTGYEKFFISNRTVENPECLFSPGYKESTFNGNETVNIEYDHGYLTGVPFASTLGIASWSEHPDEAFQLIKALMTDPDVANAIIWGEENVDYVLVDGYPCTPGSNTYINIGIPFGMANRTIAHPYYAYPKNFAEANRKVMESAEKSKIYGFMFDEAPVKDYLSACYKAYFDWFNTGKALIENDGLGELQAALHDAGIDKVLDEVNRQLAEWRVSQ